MYYCIDNINLDRVDSFKDLGVVFDTKLNFRTHIDEKVNKAYQMLGILKRNFIHLDADSFLLLYKALVRSHLEYANIIWMPYFQEDIEKIEKVQKRATKLIRTVRKLSYQARLEKLDLPTLKYRRHRGDMIELYKMVTNKYDQDVLPNLVYKVPVGMHTRGNALKMCQQHSHYNLRRHFFINRTVSIWNSLPDTIIEAETINIFKNRLDKFWNTQEIKYNWKTVLSGTGSRSIK